MLGLYIHIPFCEKKCPYCDFNSYAGATRRLVEDYVAALCHELEVRLTPLAQAGRQVDTVFVGGGTPTTLDASKLDGILQTCYNCVDVAPQAEISIEANPGTLAGESHRPEISLAELTDLRKSGFNRVSFGAQSFDDGILKTLGRIHSAAEIKEAFLRARRAGFENINLDLIFAVPGQTMAVWQSTLRQAMELQPEHLSAYALIYEEQTPFRARRDSGRLKPLDEGLELVMFEATIATLTAAGYEHYEISNYAKPGRRSQHNQIYWRDEEYIGVGAGAHQFLNGVRSWNERSPKRYIEKVMATGCSTVGSERLPPRQQVGEALMIGLRLLEGVELDEIARRFGADPRIEFQREISDVVEWGLLQERNGRLALTRQGLVLANQVFMRFL